MEPSTAGQEPGVGAIFGLGGGSKYSAIYGLGGLISRVDHPWGDKNTQHQILDHSMGG